MQKWKLAKEPCLETIQKYRFPSKTPHLLEDGYRFHFTIVYGISFIMMSRLNPYNKFYRGDSAYLCLLRIHNDGKSILGNLDYHIASKQQNSHHNMDDWDYKKSLLHNVCKNLY